MIGDLRVSHHLTKDDVYVCAQHLESRQKALDLIRSHCGRDVFVSHVNVMKGLDFFYPQPPPPLYQSPYDGFYHVPRILSDFVPVIGQPGRKMALVLYGPSRMGKTAWARSLGRHNYWKGALNINNYDEDADYHIFDDLRKFRDFDYKSWMGADDFTVSGKYRKEVTIKGGKAVIFICNQLPRAKDCTDFDWWISNTVRVHVSTPIY